MAANEDRDTLGRARLSFANEQDIDEFVETLARFEQGQIGPDEWRAFRLVRGMYGQRQTGDVQMLRVKIPQGILTRAQLDALADVADRYSRGFGHITTRQNVQFHFVKLHDVEPAMRRLADAGLTTREACGNSVRNITACPFAGIAADEVFDVTPYAEALTRHLLRHPSSSTLPRKFKIAFEGCAEDHVALAINDIGWRARVRTDNGRTVRGFRVTVAGGTSTMCRSGQVLYEFLPAAEVLNLAEAIIRVFHRLGDREHKQRNRLKFLLRSLGWERFQAEIDGQLRAVRAGGGAWLPFDPDYPPMEAPPVRSLSLPPGPTPFAIARRAAAAVLSGPGIRPPAESSLDVDVAVRDRWRRTNVTAQKQTEWSAATVTTVLGDVTGAQMRLIGELADVWGDGTVRVTSEQNILFRWVRNGDVDLLYRSLVAAGLGRPGAGTLADVTSCPGAESCRLAVTQARGLGRLLTDHLTARPRLSAAAPGLSIKISGCPNGCGQHHIAGIGFQGSLRKVGGRPAPHYFVMLGGGTADGVTTFGQLAAKIPARRCAEAVERLVDLYARASAPGESAIQFFRRLDPAVAKSTLAPLERLEPESTLAEDFVDLGDEAAFLPDVQDGECSA